MNVTLDAKNADIAETYVFLQELESEVAFVSHTKASG